MRLFLLSVSAASLLSSTALAAEKLKGRAEINWRYGHERSILMTEFWAPIAQNENSVFYGDLRMMGDNQNNREGNLGLGYRQITSIPYINSNGIVGVHSWLDRRMTERGSTFHQLAGGAEWLGEDVDLRLNGYMPLSDEKEYIVPNANPQGPALSGTGIVVDTNGALLEEPLYGFDFELGLELGQHIDFVKNNTDSFRIYGGGYYFDGDNSERITGWRTRFTADITENIQIGARFQRDDERGSQGFLEATFRFPFGHKKSYRKEGLRARLDESPERDIDIVTGNVVTDTGNRVPLINTASGSEQEVLSVDNTAAPGGDGSTERPFNTLTAAQNAASAQTIIYVKQGDRTSAGQNQGITLSGQGQQLIGSGVDFYLDISRYETANGQALAGKNLLVAPATSAPIIGAVAAGQDAITVLADDVTVAGVTVDSANTGRDGIVVRADGVGASAQNIIIRDITTQNNRTGIYLHGTNDGAVSALVERSIMSGNSQHGIAVYDDTDNEFEIDLGGGSLGSVGNNVLAGNTLEDLAVDYDGRTLAALNNWWGQATGPYQDIPTGALKPQIYFGAPINDGLAGHWTFDAEWTSNTTAYDRSGQGNHGSLSGGLSLNDQVAGQNGEAFDFNGTGNAIQTGAIDFSAVDAITIVNWRNAAYDGSIRVDVELGSNFNSINNGFLLSLNNNSGGCSHNTGGVRGDSGYNIGCYAKPPASTWSHLAYVLDKSRTGPEQSIYYNALLQTPLIQTHSNDSTNNFGNHQINIMSRNGTSLFGKDKMDDLRIYSRALDPSEISELYRMNTTSVVSTGNYLTFAP